MDGLTGLRQIQIPWKNGRWQLSLWAEDQGEWEYLPHSLKRKISANGTILVDGNWSANLWVKEVYLEGKNFEGKW